MKILIVGGGSAGWMTAATLESQFPEFDISLIESKNIKTVGVGESTIHQIQQWMRLLKIDDKQFLKEVDGSYKLSIKFTDFYKKGEYFHYPFGQPEIKGNLDLLNDWWYKKILNPKIKNSDYADCIYPTQMAYVNQNKFNEKLQYAYHFDATKFGIWLKEKYCKNINHIIDDVVSVEQNEHGIVSLNKKYKADLFIDCTGFQSLLLDKNIKEPFESYNNLLPNDSAWATKINYINKEKELLPFTNCTAIENGWVWNIPLWSRVGTGYVYSSKFVDDQTALQQFKKHLGRDDLEFKNIKMRVGIHKRLWVKNVVAIGLSAGFIEPLESNGLFSVHEFLKILIVNLRRKKISQWDKDNFNYSCKKLFKSFAEFVAMHYALSHRDDTPYWQSFLNKQWCEDLTTLNHSHINGIQKAVFNKDTFSHHDTQGGFHCIAAGMNWSPTDYSLLKCLNIFDENLFKETSKKLDDKKNHINSLVNKELNLYTYLKKNIYELKNIST